MGAGRRSVCFETLDELAAMAVAVKVATKNTFVHFQTSETFARRRGTCAGGLLGMRRESLDEQDVGARRRVARVLARAVTFQPHLAAVMRIPAVRRRSSCSTVVSSCCSPTSQSCCSPTSPMSPCWETPHRFVGAPQCASPVAGYASPLAGCMSPPAGHVSPPAGHMSPPSGYVSPHAGCASPNASLMVPQSASPCSVTQCFAMQGFTQGFSQGFVAPVGCLTPVSVQGNTSPSFQGCASPHFQGNVFPVTVPQPCSSPVEPAVAAQAQEPQQVEKKKRNKRQKVVPAAEANEVTLMMRHLSFDYSPEALEAEFKEFLPFIDFYYLPTNFETKKNLGYAFLNFHDRDAAARFTSFWEKSGIPESDDVPVQESRMQGLAANMRSFRNSSVMAVLPVELKPRIYACGVQQPFPEPDKALPRIGPRFKPTGK